MQNINIICIGKLKEPFYRDGCAEYIKRLSTSCRLSIQELQEQRLPEKPSKKQISDALCCEGVRMLTQISADSYTIALCLEGKKLTSEQMAQTVLSINKEQRSHITFLIGSSYGLCNAVKMRADFQLSFSDFTFPHQLMRLILLEQIYRGHRILSGSTYHK